MICYDIVNDGQREHVRKTLSGYGERIQYSLFECELSEGHIGELKDVLQAIIDADTDSVRFYPLCSACADKVLVQGNGFVIHDEGFVIV